VNEERAAAEPKAPELAELDAALLEIEGLRQALETRTVIGQAIGILMHREALTADAAFAHLVELSSHANTKLRDVASDIVAETERDATGSGDLMSAGIRSAGHTEMSARIGSER
jgi:hypothetical protein